MTRPPVRDLALAFGLGLLAASGQASLGAWYLALPAFAGITALVARAKGAGAAAWLGWLAGAGHFAGALNWIVEPFLIDIARHGWMAPFALLLLAFGLALFWAAAGWAAGRLVPGQGRRALTFAICLTLAEMARGHVLTGFPWALPGHVWIDTPVAQGAAWGGAYGLTLVTLLAAALPVAARGRGLAGAAVLLALLWGGGLWRLAQPVPPVTGLTLRLVQPNAEQHLKWDPDQARRLFDLQRDYTAARPRPDLVIWPETALPYLFEEGTGAVAALAKAAQGVPVAMGVQRLDGPAAFNSLAVIGPGGRLTGLYDKQHLVPFGEYVPFGDLANRVFGLRAFAAREGYGYAAGGGARLIDLGPRLGRVLPLICYEAVFPQDIRRAGERPDWLLQVTNDAWFGTVSGPFQHAALARLRAIEQGLPLVRVANTGVTAIWDAQGRETARLDFGVAAYLDAGLPGALPPTPYARWGEWPVLVLLAGLCAALVTGRRRRGA